MKRLTAWSSDVPGTNQKELLREAINHPGGNVHAGRPTAAHGGRDSVVFLDITMKTFIQRLFPSLARAAKKPDPMLRLYLAHLNGPPRVMPMQSKGI